LFKKREHIFFSDNTVLGKKLKKKKEKKKKDFLSFLIRKKRFSNSPKERINLSLLFKEKNKEKKRNAQEKFDFFLK
jgi:hypothetical protein